MGIEWVRRSDDGRACASSALYPAPIPSQARPDDSTSSVVTALTKSAGARKVAAVTMVPRRIRDVAAARYPSAVYASSMGSSSRLAGSACSR
jgi:hypothetical protein